MGGGKGGNRILVKGNSKARSTMVLVRVSWCESCRSWLMSNWVCNLEKCPRMGWRESSRSLFVGLVGLMEKNDGSMKAPKCYVHGFTKRTNN